MDNLTHSLAGWALGRAGLKSTTRKGMAALILGANMPDIDVFFSTAWWEPLAMHRGFTHSLVGGLIVMPPLLAGLLWLLDRWQVGRGARFKSGLEMHFGWLVALSYLGAITHPLLDSLTTYSVQFLSPLSGAWFHADALFIIDVWIWAALGLAIAWSRMREKQGRPWRKVPQAAIAAVLLYVALNLAISETARAALRARLAGPEPDAIYASPPPVTFWKRTLVWRQGRGIGRADYDPLRRGLVSAGPHGRDNLDLPVVRRAMLDPALKRFLGWSTMTTATVEQKGCTATVTFTDARYPARRTRGTFLRQTTVKTC